MSYQDVVIGEQVMEVGDRDCQSRYEALSPLLYKYERPFTLLDIGASEGYFLFKGAYEHPESIFVGVDDNPALPSLCSANGFDNTIALCCRLSYRDLVNLSECEHFDVVLALNVLHHFTDWEKVLDVLFQLGDNLVIETPHYRDTGACNRHLIPGIYDELDKLPYDVLGVTTSHTSKYPREMWHFETPGNSLSKSFWDVPFHPSHDLGDIVLTSTFFEKVITFNRKEERKVWIPGINLRTYQHLKGKYPLTSTLTKQLRRYPLPQETHGDIRPWNFILSGEKLYLIDGGDDRSCFQDDKLALRETVSAVARNSLKLPL